MEPTDQDNKKKYVAVAISAAIVVIVIGAGVFFSFKKKPGDVSHTKEASVEVDKQGTDKEATDRKEDVVKAENVETDKIEVDKVEAVEEVNIDREEYAKLKDRVEKSYKEAEGDLAKTSHRYFKKLLGEMAGILESAQSADSSQDLVTAYKEYKSLEKMIEENKRSQVDYKEFSQLDSELKALVKKVSARQGREYAKESFKEASIAMGNADEVAKEGKFIKAIESLQKAKDSFNRAMSELDKIVDENWRKGNAALETGDNVVSNAAFVTVKNIDRGYPGIDDSIKRSETIHIVHPKEQDALKYEENGLLEMANSLYTEILEIDPLSQIARDGLCRTEDAVLTETVRKTIVALDEAISRRGLWVKAKGLLGNLKALDPGNERIDNYERVIGNELDRVKIDQLRWEAGEAEKKFDWDEAVKKYEEILTINPDLADIQKRYERAEKGQEYRDGALDAVEQARKFADSDDAGGLKKAVYLLEKAGGLYGLKKGLVEEIDELIVKYKARLEQLEMPVSFTIVSDGKTSIKFWKVGRFRPFTRKGFTLKPGNYTIQGLRKGYREKFINFDVKPIELNQTLEVICDEKI